MAVDAQALRPGHVLVTRNEQGWFGRLIRLFTDAQWNHVIVFSHWDERGMPWGLEARYPTCGWVECGDALGNQRTIANTRQPLTPEGGAAIVKLMAEVVGVKYSTRVIAEDLLLAVDKLLRPETTAGFFERTDADWKAHEPLELVCSSAADRAYDLTGNASPKPDRHCTPGDWGWFIIEHGYG